MRALLISMIVPVVAAFAQNSSALVKPESTDVIVERLRMTFPLHPGYLSWRSDQKIPK
jgi:hypothetical protein